MIKDPISAWISKSSKKKKKKKKNKKKKKKKTIFEHKKPQF